MQCNGKNPVDPNGETHVVFKHPHIEYLYIQKCMYWELIKGHEKKALWSIKMSSRLYTKWIYTAKKILSKHFTWRKMNWRTKMKALENLIWGASCKNQ